MSNLLKYGPKLDEEMLEWIKVVVINLRISDNGWWVGSGTIETMPPHDLRMCLFFNEEEVKKALDRSLAILPNTLDLRLYKILHGKSYYDRKKRTNK